MNKAIEKSFLCFVISLILCPAYADISANKCLAEFNSHIINSETAWFDECNLNDKDLSVIVSYLNAHPEITQLYLLDNHISDDGAMLLAKNKTLKMLELRNNAIGTKGAIALAHSSIHMLDLQGNKFKSSQLVTLAQNNAGAANNRQHGKEAIILG